MSQEIKLPDPDTHCFDDDSQPPKDVWSYSAELVRQIIEADRAQRGEPVAWMVVNESGTDAFVTADPTLAQSGQRALPLYTAPQPERKRNEVEVQELLAFIEHYKADTFDLGMIEQKVRRTLGVPKP